MKWLQENTGATHVPGLATVAQPHGSQPGWLGDILQARTGCSGDGDGVTAVGRRLGCGEKRPQGSGVPKGSVPKGMASEADGADVPEGEMCSMPSWGGRGLHGLVEGTRRVLAAAGSQQEVVGPGGEIGERPRLRHRPLPGRPALPQP